MSRCFPFPPPGYAGTCSSNEALILSIKLQRENEKANSDREREKAKSSDRKKEKKEKKKEKKRKREEEKGNNAVDSEKQKLDKNHQADKYKAVDAKVKSSLLRDESQLLEKSSVTEEHGRPVESQNASCSSDSTGNSTKRRRPNSSSPGGTGIQTHGNIIRICLSSSQKTDKPSTSGRSEQECRLPSQSREGASTSFSKVRPCSNLLKKELALKQKDVIVQAPAQPSNIASTSMATIQLATRQDKQMPCMPEMKIESVAPKEKLSSHEKKILKEDKNQLPRKEKLSSHEKKMLKKELKYKNLFDSRVPPLMLSEPAVDEGDDEDWLFGKKGDEKSAIRTVARDSENSSDNLQRCASAVMQPRAHFLQDADIYALPFTVPF